MFSVRQILRCFAPLEAARRFEQLGRWVIVNHQLRRRRRRMEVLQPYTDACVRQTSAAAFQLIKPLFVHVFEIGPAGAARPLVPMRHIENGIVLKTASLRCQSWFCCR